jgi:hypothetical protein
LGPWTLSIYDSTEAQADAIANALGWHSDPDGFIQLTSSDLEVMLDRDWAEMFVLERDPQRQVYNFFGDTPSMPAQ